jgi:hypothetical protein
MIDVVSVVGVAGEAVVGEGDTGQAKSQITG